MAKKRQRSQWKLDVRREVARALKQSSSHRVTPATRTKTSLSTHVQSSLELKVHPAVESDIRLVLVLSGSLVLVIVLMSWLDRTYDLLKTWLAAV